MSSMDANSMLAVLAERKPEAFHDIMSKLLKAVNGLSLDSDKKAPARQPAVSASVATPVKATAIVKKDSATTDSKSVSASEFKNQGWPQAIQGLKMSKVHYAVSKVIGPDGKGKMTPVPVYSGGDGVFVKFAYAGDTDKGKKVDGISLRTM